MAVIDVWVVGVDSTTAGMMVEAEHITKAALAKMTAAANAVAATARSNMSSHSLSGATVSAIKVSPPRVISKYLDATAKGMFAQEMTTPSWVRARIPAGQPGGGRFMTWNPLMVTVPKLVTITVGIDHNNVPPFFVGSTFEHGWHSDAGLQPPTQPLAEWALKRGLASTAREAAHIGFIIARNIGQRGYEFGEHHWLSDAWEANKGLVAAASSGFVR